MGLHNPRLEASALVVGSRTVPKKRLSPAAKAKITARMKALNADPVLEAEDLPCVTTGQPAGPLAGAGGLETEDARWLALLAEQDDSTADPVLEAARCRSLWQEVLLQGLRDLLNPTSIEVVREQPKWRSWIGSRDFREVCDLAGVDPEATAATFKRVAEGDVATCAQVEASLGYMRGRDDKVSVLGRNRRAGKRGQSVRRQSSTAMP